MKVDYSKFGSWLQTNEDLGRWLRLDSKRQEARVFKGVGHALFETCSGLTRLYPHKRKIYYFADADPFFNEPIKFLAGEGFDVNALSMDDLESPESVIEKFDRETLMVLMPEDEVFTSRVHASTKFCEAMDESRVFRVRLSHQKHFSTGVQVNPHRYDLFIYSLGVNRALSIVGDRAKFSCPVAEALYWEPEEVDQVKNQLVPSKFDSQKILDFEASKPAGAELIFSSDSERVFDRAVLCWQDVDGYAMTHYLSHALKFNLHEPGFEKRLETTSLSRWGGVRTMDWLKARGYTAEQIRGMVMISHELVNEDLAAKIEAVHQKIVKMQIGA